MRSGFSKTIAFVSLFVSLVLLGFIVVKFVIPTINGTISETPRGQVYTIDDVDPAIKKLLNEGVTRYAGTKLSGKEKTAYDRLLYGMLSYADRIDIRDCKLRMDGLQKVYSCIRNDYPELFFIPGSCNVFTSGKLVTDCSPSYLYPKEEALEYAKNIVQVKDLLLSQIKNLSKYQQAMYIFNYIIDSTVYDEESFNKFNSNNNSDDPSINTSSTILGTLFNKKALCEGYSRTFQYLTNACAIDCLYVTGTAKGESHAWNYILLDGSYYCVDLTWCDPTNNGNTKTFAYCMIDEKSFKKDRVSDVPYALPACNGTTYNYYNYNHYDLYAFDMASLQSIFLKSYATNKNFVEFRCVTPSVLDAFKMAVENKSIFHCFDTISATYHVNFRSFNYVIIDDTLIVRVILK